MKINKKIGFALLAFVLLILSFLTIIIHGDTYVAEINLNNQSISIDSLKIELEQDTEVVNITNATVENGILRVKLAAKAPGRAGISIRSDDHFDFHTVYVHQFNVITYDDYFGKATGDDIIPVAILLLLFAAYYLLINKYRNSMRDSLYKYQNVTLLGAIIFLSFVIIAQIFQVINYRGIVGSLEFAIATSKFSFFVLPAAFIVSILIIVSNGILLFKEGFTWKNMLGIILGAFLCITTILPEAVSYYLQTSGTFIDVHNEAGIWRHLMMAIDTAVYSIVTYLECVLIASITLTIKAARHIPKFDKDYILILGCMVRSDDTLSNILRARADRAIEFAKMQKEATGKDIIFVPSGGKGDDEPISEASAIKKYLLSKGIRKQKILLEDKSTNTYENIKFSQKIIDSKKKNAKVAFATTNYHVFRAGTFATELGLRAEGIGSKTKAYFWINAFIREYIAELVYAKKKHIATILTLLAMSIAVIGALYYSINMY